MENKAKIILKKLFLFGFLCFPLSQTLALENETPADEPRCNSFFMQTQPPTDITEKREISISPTHQLYAFWITNGEVSQGDTITLNCTGAGNNVHLNLKEGQHSNLDTWQGVNFSGQGIMDCHVRVQKANGKADSCPAFRVKILDREDFNEQVSDLNRLKDETYIQNPEGPSGTAVPIKNCQYQVSGINAGTFACDSVSSPPKKNPFNITPQNAWKAAEAFFKAPFSQKIDHTTPRTTVSITSTITGKTETYETSFGHFATQITPEFIPRGCPIPKRDLIFTKYNDTHSLSMGIDDVLVFPFRTSKKRGDILSLTTEDGAIGAFTGKTLIVSQCPGIYNPEAFNSIESRNFCVSASISKAPAIRVGVGNLKDFPEETRMVNTRFNCLLEPDTDFYLNVFATNSYRVMEPPRTQGLWTFRHQAEDKFTCPKDLADATLLHGNTCSILMGARGKMNIAPTGPGSGTNDTTPDTINSDENGSQDPPNPPSEDSSTSLPTCTQVNENGEPIGDLGSYRTLRNTDPLEYDANGEILKTEVEGILIPVHHETDLFTGCDGNEYQVSKNLDDVITIYVNNQTGEDPPQDTKNLNPDLNNPDNSNPKTIQCPTPESKVKMVPLSGKGIDKEILLQNEEVLSIPFTSGELGEVKKIALGEPGTGEHFQKTWIISPCPGTYNPEDYEVNNATDICVGTGLEVSFSTIVGISRSDYSISRYKCVLQPNKEYYLNVFQRDAGRIPPYRASTLNTCRTNTCGVRVSIR